MISGGTIWYEGRGIHAGLPTSQIDIRNMNIIADGNGMYGLFAEFGGVITAQGVVGENTTFSVSHNQNQISVDSWADGKGIYANGISSSGGVTYRAQVLLSDFQTINLNNNAFGAFADNGGFINFQGLADQTTTFSASNNKISYSGMGNVLMVSGMG